MKYKKTTYIVVSLLIILISLGGTFAYWGWTTSEREKTDITFTINSEFSCSADGGGNVTSSEVELVPTTCANSEHVIKRTITTNVINNSQYSVGLDMWLTVNSMDEGLRNSNNFRYALTTSSNSCNMDVISQGNFKNVSNSDNVKIIEEDVYQTTGSKTYYLWIWLDATETSMNTVEQNFNLSLGGTCTNIE